MLLLLNWEFVSKIIIFTINFAITYIFFYLFFLERSASKTCLICRMTNYNMYKRTAKIYVFIIYTKTRTEKITSRKMEFFKNFNFREYQGKKQILSQEALVSVWICGTRSLSFISLSFLTIVVLIFVTYSNVSGKKRLKTW